MNTQMKSAVEEVVQRALQRYFRSEDHRTEADLVSDEDENVEISAERIDEISREIVPSIGSIAETVAKFLFVTGNMVVCELQHNSKSIYVNDAKKCANCKRYYCKDHRLKYCTHCGHKM